MTGAENQQTQFTCNSLSPAGPAEIKPPETTGGFNPARNSVDSLYWPSLICVSCGHWWETRIKTLLYAGRDELQQDNQADSELDQKQEQSNQLCTACHL